MQFFRCSTVICLLVQRTKLQDHLVFRSVHHVNPTRVASVWALSISLPHQTQRCLEANSEWATLVVYHLLGQTGRFMEKQNSFKTKKKFPVLKCQTTPCSKEISKTIRKASLKNLSRRCSLSSENTARKEVEWGLNVCFLAVPLGRLHAGKIVACSRLRDSRVRWIEKAQTRK